MKEADLSEYKANLDVSGAVKWLGQAAEPITIVTHAKPDGDALGSVVALAAALTLTGKTVAIRLVGPIAHNLKTLACQDWIEMFDEAEVLPSRGAVVVVDTGAWSQLGPVRPWVEPRLDQTLIIDHHLNGDVTAANRLIDSGAAATCEVLAPIIDQMLEAAGIDPNTSGQNFEGGKPTAHVEQQNPSAQYGPDHPDPHAQTDRRKLIHEMLFVGLASDTGWFRFSNTTPRTHRLAADLMSRGVDHTRLHTQLEQNERPEKLALLIRAMQSLRTVADGRAAVMVLRNADFLETGAREEETERLIDLPQQVGAIQVIALLSERSASNHGGGPGLTRLSFRSKAGPQAINVAELAQQFQGGGHARAAGAKFEDPIDEVIPRVERALADAISHADPVTAGSGALAGL